MWCPKCKETRPQAKEKRAFSKKVLGVIVLIGVIWTLVTIAAVQFGGDAAMGIGGVGSVVFLVSCCAIAMGHDSGDWFAEYHCPVCDATMMRGRVQEEANAGHAFEDLHKQLEASREAQQAAEQMVEKLQRELKEAREENITDDLWQDRADTLQRELNEARTTIESLLSSPKGASGQSAREGAGGATIESLLGNSKERRCPRPDCGSPVDKAASYCGRCGRRIS